MANPSALAVIEKRTTKELVIDRVRDAILSGELSSGQRITEPDLAKSFGVGQATIREALIELEHMGFVQRREPRKTFVTHLTPTDIAQIYAIRIPLELLAVEMAASAKADLSELEQAVDTMEAAAQKGNPTEFKSSDHGFHRALWRAAANPHLAECLDPLVTKLFAFAYITINGGQTTAEKRQELVVLHRKMVIALRSGDAEAAKQALLDSMDMSWVTRDGESQ